MTEIYRLLPDVCREKVDNYLHKYRMMEVVSEFHHHDLLLRRLTIILQHYAMESRIRVIVCKNGKVGQNIYLSHPLFDEIFFSGDIGRSWHTYHEDTDSWLNSWRMEGHVTTADPQYHFNQNEWFDYSNWRQDIKPGWISIRLMLKRIPIHTDFDELDELDSAVHFTKKYPGFIPIQVMIPTHCVFHVETPLTTSQNAVKYGLQESVAIISKLLSDSEGLTTLEVHEHFERIMEHLIVHPEILIHSVLFREQLYGKMAELETYIIEQRKKRNTRSFYKKYDHMWTTIQTMYSVLHDIQFHELYEQ